MTGVRFRPKGWRAALSIALALLAVLASIASGGSVPHAHDGPGLYNQEHDLTTLAALGGVGPVPGVVAVAVTPVTRRPLPRPPALRQPSRPSGDNGPRAPPASA